MWALISVQHICGFRSQMERFTLMEITHFTFSLTSHNYIVLKVHLCSELISAHLSKTSHYELHSGGGGGGGVRVRSHVCCKGVGSLVFIWQASEGKVILYCGLFNIWWDTSLTCLQCNLNFMPWCSLCVSSVGTAEESVGELCCQLGFITGAHTRKSSFSHRRAKWFYAFLRKEHKIQHGCFQ